MHMTDKWLKSMDNSLIVGAVLLDFTAAFDVIDHSILIAKLKSYGFSPSSLAWIESYLIGRTQRVFFNGSYSSSGNMSCGVPQGSCLGPLLFSIFINDLPYAVKNADLIMYADDSTLFCASPTSVELKDNLQIEFNNITKWIRMNKLVLNISQTKSIVFGSRYALANATALDLFVEGISVEQVTNVKLLGVKLDNLLSWSDQIDHIVSKMGRGIAISRKCSAYVSSSVMNDVVRSLVLSHLDYCPVIWSSAAEKHLKKLQIAQNRAARLVLNCSFRTNVGWMHRQLSWLTVDMKLQYCLLMFMYNVIWNNTPQFFHEQILYIGFCHGHYTRQVSSGHLVVPNHNQNSMMRTVLHRAFTAWNMLPLNLRQTSSRFSFKRLLKHKLMCLL